MDYTNPYSTEINEGLMSSRDPISNAVSTLLGGAVASVVDFGASVWNTLPGDEVETGDILERIGGDPLRVYQEHPDAVQAASLIGGSFVGGGLALKGMGLIRNGGKAAKWYNTAGETARREKLADLLARGQQETSAYKKMLWSNRAAAAGNAAIDTVAAEAAMLGTMGAHPLLEDYWDNPVKNVGLSLLIGGGLGTVGGLIVDRAAVKTQLGQILQGPLDEVNKAIRPISGGMPAATAFQENAISIGNLGAIMKKGTDAGKTAETDLTMQITQKYMRDLERDNGALFDSMLAPELRSLPLEEKSFLREEIKNNPAFHGVDSVRVISAKEVMTGVRATTVLAEEPTLIQKVINKVTGETSSKLTKAVYFPELRKFGTEADIQHHAGAAILDLSPEQAAKRIPDARSYAPNTDRSLEVAATPTPHIEADFISWKLKFDKMSDEDFAKHLKKSHLAADDLPQLEALAQKIGANPVFSGLDLKVAGRSDKLPVDELLGLVRTAKFEQVNSLVRDGYPLDVIAKRTSMPVESVEQFLASGKTRDSFEQIDKLFRFGGAEEAKAALGVKNRPLSVSGNLRKADYTSGHANINTAAVQQMNQLWASTTMMQSSSPMVRTMAENVFERFGDALAVVRAKMGTINNELMGSSFFTSSDHAMRHMGDIAPILNVIGKDVTHVANQTSKRLLEPMSKMMADIKADDVITLTEINVAHNLNASLSGYRIYKDRKFWVPQEGLNEAGETVTTMVPALFRGQEFSIKSDLADSILQEADKAGKELYQMEEARRKILGQASNNNIGFWMPAVNPVNKHVAYLHDPVTDVTRMVYGRTVEELESGLKIIANTELVANPNLLIVRKGDQQWWSHTNGRADAINMTTADAGKLKTGSAAPAIVPINRDVLSEIVSGYEHYINASTRNLADVALSDITDSLRRYSSYATSNFDAQPLGLLARVKQKPKDAGKAALNVLLGNPMLGEYEGWKTLSSGFEIGLSKGADVARSTWHTMQKALPRKDMSKFDFGEYEATLAKAGVVNPFKDLDAAAFEIAQQSGSPEIGKRIVSATNGMTATMALRFGELAHPLVNLMSMPILTALSNGKHLPSTFMGVAKKTGDVATSQVMYEGVRAMHSPRFEALNKKWEELGYFTPVVSEATKTLQASRKFEKGAMAGVEKAIESNFVTMMSKPADFSEALSRKISMNTGYQLGKRLYPELDDNALTIFARDFMDKSLGNYSAAQRPAMFQGTLGMALGLFQTYMLTLAQAMYRNVEIKDWKTLGKGMLAQSTIFGHSSLPGFAPISEMIGEHFSDEHFDLTTGTYRALGDDAANWVLYGLPSNLSQSAAYSRGDIAPRVPNVLAGAQNMVGVNMAMQAAAGVKNMAAAMGEGSSAGQAMLQALAMQNLSRPIARNAESVMALTGEGGTINQGGKTVQNSAEVLTFNGIASRVFSMRPLEEAKLREMQHMNRFYEASDRDRRSVVINSLRTAMRAGNNTPEKVASIAEEYMRNGGSPAGWRAAYRNAQATTNVSGAQVFADQLKDDSPFQYMMDSLD